MDNTVTITTLVENTVHARGLLAEHGLSFHLQVGQRSVLFDTGQSDLFLRNALNLRLTPADAQAIVLSHGHNDHTGGLQAARQPAPQARLFLHPAALTQKFIRHADGAARSIGMNPQIAEAISKSAESAVWTSTPTEILDGIFVTGAIPRENTFEDTGGSFFLDAACTQPDPLTDDQALFFDTANGLVILLGCAHSGVVNTLDYIRRLTNGRPIHTVMGGLHLLNASPERMDKTIAAFRRLGIQCLAPAHCTGLPAIAQFWTALPTRCALSAVGTSLSFRR